MNSTRIGYAVALSASGSAVSAQTSTCMEMGPDMVQCNSSTGATMTCMNMGGTMATCQTMQPAAPASSDNYNGDGGAALGASLGNLIRSIGERSFRKKVGAMLANGDCSGAAKYALEKGRLELGYAIQDSCRSATAQPTGALDVPSQISMLAQKITPHEIEPGLSIARAQANGSQLVLDFLVAGEAPIAAHRAEFASESCADPKFRELYENGATLRSNYLDQSGAQLGTYLITASDCGVR